MSLNELKAEYKQLVGEIEVDRRSFPTARELVREIRESIAREGEIKGVSFDDRLNLSEKQMKSVAVSPHEMITKLAAEVEAAAEELGLSSPRPVYAGVYPTGSFNAQAAPVTNGVLLLVNTGLMMFIWQSVKIFTLAFQFNLGDDAKEAREDPHSTVDAQLSRDEATFWLADIVAAYLFLGSSTFSKRFPAEGGVRGTMLFLMATNAEKYVLAHEYGHAFAGHLSEPKCARAQTPAGDLELVKKSWEQEVEADVLGIRLLLPPSKMVIKTAAEAEYTSICLSGPFIFFALAELIDACLKELHGIGRDMIVISDHPPSNWRADLMRKYLTDMGAESLLSHGQGVASWLKDLEADVCASVKEIVSKAQL